MKNVVDTCVQYRDLSGQPRTKTTRKFDHQTNLSIIKNWISGWWKGNRTFDLEIQDQHGGFVDFDDEYNDEYKPYNILLESIQPPESSHRPIKLRIVSTDGKILLFILTFFYLFKTR